MNQVPQPIGLNPSATKITPPSLLNLRNMESWALAQFSSNLVQHVTQQIGLGNIGAVA